MNVILVSIYRICKCLLLASVSDITSVQKRGGKPQIIVETKDCLIRLQE